MECVRLVAAFLARGARLPRLGLSMRMVEGPQFFHPMNELRLGRHAAQTSAIPLLPQTERTSALSGHDNRPGHILAPDVAVESAVVRIAARLIEFELESLSLRKRRRFKYSGVRLNGM